LSQLDDCAILAHPTKILDVILDDPDDNRILACAIAAQAGFIVSGDNHLLRPGAYRGIRIMKGVDFMLLLPTLEDNGQCHWRSSGTGQAATIGQGSFVFPGFASRCHRR
jgi:hypothetical protein